MNRREPETERERVRARRRVHAGLVMYTCSERSTRFVRAVAVPTKARESAGYKYQCSAFDTASQALHLEALPCPCVCARVSERAS